MPAIKNAVIASNTGAAAFLTSIASPYVTEHGLERCDRVWNEAVRYFTACTFS